MKLSDRYKDEWLHKQMMRDNVLQPSIKQIYTDQMVYLAMKIETSEAVERKVR